MDGPELTPATRKRPHTELRPAEITAAGEDGSRFAAIEAALRAIDVRLEQLERSVSTGFQEMASRSLVIAEATDETLAGIRDALLSGAGGAAGDDAPIAAAIRSVDDRLEAAEPRWEEIKRRVDDLAVAVVALQPTIDAILDLRSHVDLVGTRLADLLGGPSLTELMDRLDEIADRNR